MRPGGTSGRRSLPIRGSVEETEAAWRDPAGRAAVLAGLAVADASIAVGEQDRDFGRTVTLSLQLEAAVPSMATQVLAGKAVRCLKALVETGEVPTTDHNSSYRADAGEQGARMRALCWMGVNDRHHALNEDARNKLGRTAGTPSIGEARWPVA